MRPLFGRLAICMFGLVCSTQAGASEDRSGGKLLLTEGISSVQGAAGGGLANWAVIAGNETEDGIGATAHATYVTLPDFRLASAGVAVGWRDRLEIAYARERFDTRAAGAALGLGRGFAFSEDIYSAKLRLFGDAVWDQNAVVPQIAVGIQHGHANQGAIIHPIGGQQADGTDFTVSATKVVLSQSLVLDATLRFTKANQFGLLGFGGDALGRRTAQFEGSAGLLVAPDLVIGAEYRTKPNDLRFAREDDAFDVFAAWAVGHHVTLTVAYADLGSIATFAHQRGVLLSIQGSY